MAKKKYYGDKSPRMHQAGDYPADIFPKDAMYMDAKSPCGGLDGPAADDMKAIDARNKEMENRLKAQKLPPYLGGGR